MKAEPKWEGLVYRKLSTCITSCFRLDVGSWVDELADSWTSGTSTSLRSWNFTCTNACTCMNMYCSSWALHLPCSLSSTGAQRFLEPVEPWFTQWSLRCPGNVAFLGWTWRSLWNKAAKTLWQNWSLNAAFEWCGPWMETQLIYGFKQLVTTLKKIHFSIVLESKFPLFATFLPLQLNRETEGEFDNKKPFT